MVDVPEGEGYIVLGCCSTPILDPLRKSPWTPTTPPCFSTPAARPGCQKPPCCPTTLVVNTIQMRRWLAVARDGDERMIGALPFFHVYGMTVEMSLAIYLGGQLIILPDPRDVVHLMKTIDRLVPCP